MMGKEQRMPKRARYPLFALGLAIIILGSIAASSIGYGPSTIGIIAAGGFTLVFLSVAIR
ncbi:MAG: hypothetical protein HY296_07010 [Thaumarchaeota archaeon]|nr:hypothetical protein [Nitrososphaerota archaeon]